MSSSFNVHSAGAYERLMGRWSKKLAPMFIDFAGIAANERILDVGCGNGSLTFALQTGFQVDQRLKEHVNVPKRIALGQLRYHLHDCPLWRRRFHWPCPGR